MSLRTLALVSRDGIQTAGLFKADDTITDDTITQIIAIWHFTLDATSYADETEGGFLNNGDGTIVHTIEELKAYVATVRDPAS